MDPTSLPCPTRVVQVLLAKLKAIEELADKLERSPVDCGSCSQRTYHAAQIRKIIDGSDALPLKRTTIHLWGFLADSNDWRSIQAAVYDDCVANVALGVTAEIAKHGHVVQAKGGTYPVQYAAAPTALRYTVALNGEADAKPHMWHSFIEPSHAWVHDPPVELIDSSDV